MGVDPITMTVMALTAGSTALSTVGNIMEGNAKGDEMVYQSQVAKYNEGMALREGDIEAMNKSLETRARIGTIRANQAASGVDVNTGTASEVQAAQAQLGELDALTIRSNAARRAFGYKQDAAMLKKGANTARNIGYINAASSLIGGASSMAGDYHKWQMAGGGGTTGAGNNIGYSDLVFDEQPTYQIGSHY